MQFGLFGSAQAKRGGPDVDSGQGFKDFVEYNVEAESLGFASTFVVEHHFTGFGQVSASLNLLTWVAARTTTLRLGTAVIVLPWHNPVLLAEQAATIDLMSDGRLELGVGKGYRHNEFAGFCVPMEEADARFNESLDVILDASDAGCGSTGCALALYPAGSVFYLYTPQLDHLSNDAENFGGMMTEVHICNSVTSDTFGNTCN